MRSGKVVTDVVTGGRGGGAEQMVWCTCGRLAIALRHQVAPRISPHEGESVVVATHVSSEHRNISPSPVSRKASFSDYLERHHGIDRTFPLACFMSPVGSGIDLSKCQVLFSMRSIVLRGSQH